MITFEEKKISSMKYNFKRKYGLNVYNQEPEELLEYACSNNLHFVEINLSHQDFSIDNYNAERINKLRELSTTNNIKLSFHIPHYINICDIIPYYKNTHLRHLKKCIHVASELRATHVTLHIGSFFWFPAQVWMRTKALKRFIKNLDSVLKFCEEKQMIIALENVVPVPSESDSYLLGDNIDDFKFIFKNINSKYLKFCLDTGHANMGEGVLKYINSLHDKLCCLHFHDNNGLDDEHLAVGKGTVPWKDLADELIKIDYRGPIISECRDIKPHKAAILFQEYFDDCISELELNHSASPVKS